MDMINSIDSLDHFYKLTINNASIFYTSSPKLTYLLMASFMFFVYYYKEVVRKPNLICSNPKFREFLIENCSETIDKPVYPTFWSFNSMAQTILANVFRGTLSKLTYKRELINMPDNGLVSIDWYKDDDSNKPICILMPGLTGDSHTEYIRSLVPIAHAAGVRCCVLNNRGRGGMELKTCRLYCGANCEDVEYVLNHIRSKNPDSKIIAVGISLGGIVLGRYLSEKGEKAVVDAAMLISVCYDFVSGCVSLEKNGLNLALNRHLSRSLQTILISHRKVLEQNKNLDFDSILESETLREFDERFTIKMWGYEKVEDYYDDASLKDKIHAIRKPTLCLNAADDMFQPLESLPIEKFESNPNLALLITSRGGHIGFMDNSFPMVPYFSERLCQQYLNGLTSLDNIQKSIGHFD